MPPQEVSAAAARGEEGSSAAGAWKSILRQNRPEALPLPARAPSSSRPATTSDPDNRWWIGWIEEVSGVNCQEAIREELIESLRVTLREALTLRDLSIP